MTIRTRFSYISFVAIVLAVFASCSPFRTHREHVELEMSAPLPPIAVGPPRLTYGHDSMEAYARALDIVETLETVGASKVIAPWDVTIDPGEPWPFDDRLVERALGDNGIDRDEALAIYVVVDERADDRVVYAPDGFGGDRTALYRARFLIEARAESVLTGEELARVTVEFEEDPFADGDDSYDLRPMLTDGLERAVTELYEELLAIYDPPATPVDTGFSGTTSPAAGVYYNAGPPPNVADSISELGEVEAQVELYNWYRRFVPGITVGEMNWLSEAPAGVFVTDVESPTSELRTGDIITHVGSRRVFGTHTLQRIVTTYGPAPFTVWRQGTNLTVAR